MPWPHDFTLVSHLSPTSTPLSPVSCGRFGRVIFTLVSLLMLSPNVESCGQAPNTLVSHLSPCLSPFLLHLSPCCLTSQNHGGLKLLTPVNQTKRDKATCQYNSAYLVDLHMFCVRLNCRVDHCELERFEPLTV